MRRRARCSWRRRARSLIFGALLLHYELGVTAWLVIPLVLAGGAGCFHAGKWERSRAMLHYVWGYRARERDEASEFVALATSAGAVDG